LALDPGILLLVCTSLRLAAVACGVALLAGDLDGILMTELARADS